MKHGYIALPSHDTDHDNDAAAGEQDFVFGSQSLPDLPRGPLARVGTGVRPIRRKASIPRRRIIIDAHALDSKLKEWSAAIARRINRRRTAAARDLDIPYDIIASAYSPVEPFKQVVRNELCKTLDHQSPCDVEQVLAIVEEVRAAIRLGVHPRLNKAGSSGSYFAKSVNGTTLAIYKPKDEEPYGPLNPKLTKWLQRHLLAPFVGFGRACLLPNFSYLSEAGASLLSERLCIYNVPHTSIQSLSSPAFYYDWIHRRAHKQNSRPLPAKDGSFQLFLNGYTDASEFLRKHPWPGRNTRDTLDLGGDMDIRRRARKRRNLASRLRLLCGAAGVDDDSDEEIESPRGPSGVATPGEPDPSFVWTAELAHDFRLELEKLVILDVLMRNTDRGLDNFMIKICKGQCESRIFSCTDQRSEETVAEIQTRQPGAQMALSLALADNTEDVPYTIRPHTHIAAIDNSLSWPIHHPNSWRSYCYGWLFLPSSLIGLPFSHTTRSKFLPLLTDPKWIAQTVFELRQLFSIDSGFSESMFQKQMSVFKGQAWNVVMTLRDPDAGALELCRRKTRLVHDDEIVVADDQITRELLESVAQPMQPGISAANAETHDPSSVVHAIGTNHPMDPLFSRGTGSVIERRQSEQPLGIRQSMQARRAPRPIPLAKQVDLSRATFGNASGVAIIEHMDRLQKEEEEHSDLKYDFCEEDEHPLSLDNGRPTNDRQGLSFDYTRKSLGTRFRSGSLDTNRIASQPLPQTAMANVATRVVIVERVVEVDARPFFARC